MSVKITLSRTNEPAERRELVFNEETISIGREPSNVLPLAGTQISKLHARIDHRGSEYYILDLNSTNATYVNGEKLIPGKQWLLHQGDKVSISDYDLEFFPVDTPSSTPPIPEEHKSRASRNTVADFSEDDSLAGPVGKASSELAERWSRVASEIQKTLESFDILDLIRRHE